MGGQNAVLVAVYFSSWFLLLKSFSCSGSSHFCCDCFLSCFLMLWGFCCSGFLLFLVFLSSLCISIFLSFCLFFFLYLSSSTCLSFFLLCCLISIVLLDSSSFYLPPVFLFLHLFSFLFLQLFSFCNCSLSFFCLSSFSSFCLSSPALPLKTACVILLKASLWSGTRHGSFSCMYSASCSMLSFVALKISFVSSSLCR